MQQQTYLKQEKLKSKKLIDALFIEGRSVKSFPLRMVFIETPLPYPEINIQAGVSVSKRNHKLAVTRNRIKRLMREAYRTHKNIIDTKGTTFAVLIIYTGRDVIPYEEIERAMIKLLKRFNDAITTTHS
ncbi:ribonuclease P protein component [Dokdonia sp.]|uniref:ribonuclease P protein component n=1 Tax=Dokdonia sp. TaxID=2024995 RepID=UPI003262F08A